MLFPKPEKRISDPKAGIDKIKREGRCRVCKRVPSGHPLDKLNRMHLVPKGQRGDDVDANIVPGCGSGTSGCHGVLTTRNRDGRTGMTWERAAVALRISLTEEEEDYITNKMGHDWLERNYPLEERPPWL